MKKKMTARATRERDALRAFTVEAVARVLALARTQALVMEDDDMHAVFERMDSLLFHEARNFLKLPYLPRRKRRRR